MEALGEAGCGGRGGGLGDQSLTRAQRERRYVSMIMAYTVRVEGCDSIEPT